MNNHSVFTQNIWIYTNRPTAAGGTNNFCFNGSSNVLMGHVNFQVPSKNLLSSSLANVTPWNERILQVSRFSSSIFSWNIFYRPIIDGLRLNKDIGWTVGKRPAEFISRSPASRLARLFFCPHIVVSRHYWWGIDVSSGLVSDFHKRIGLYDAFRTGYSLWG